MNMRGFPHSDIPGSKPVCGSPELFAAYHVLHRHLSPRHSPYALSSLTIELRTNAVTRTFACRPAALILLGTLRVCFLWSEKTTVCRIFNCQRTELIWKSCNLKIWKSLDLQIPRFPHFQILPGGEYRARTGDLLFANQALSQLS